jgi:uncharacterized OsmC-like protein
MMGMLEYDVHLVSPSEDDTRATVKDAVIVLDTSRGGRTDAPNAAELLLTALATCITKGVRRAAAMNHFEVGRIEVRVHGVRQDSPPKMSQIRYQVSVETAEPDHRLDLLHRNVRKFGTVTNTVAPGTDLEGTLSRLGRTEA